MERSQLTNYNGEAFALPVVIDKRNHYLIISREKIEDCTRASDICSNEAYIRLVQENWGLFENSFNAAFASLKAIAPFERPRDWPV
ncbi:MAG: hypothetical protein NW215_06615 [Hyphomicrobiales bacterium]|nr:hypothetical protein [Hyphomicrobiales bacterium]